MSEPSDDRPEGDAPAGEADPFGRRPRRMPSQRLLLGVSILAGVADGFAVRNSTGSVGRTIVSALFMTAFVFVGLRFVTKVRFRYRPPDVDPVERDPSLPPPRGGWAAPTGGQRARRRLSRLLEPTKPGPRRR